MAFRSSRRVSLSERRGPLSRKDRRRFPIRSTGFPYQGALAVVAALRIFARKSRARGPSRRPVSVAVAHCREILFSRHHFAKEPPCSTKAARARMRSSGEGVVNCIRLHPIGVGLQSRLHNVAKSSPMLKNSTAIFIDRVKEALGTPKDEDLAARLEVGKSTIASWRRRNDIPAKRRENIEAVSNIQFDWSLDGDLEYHRVLSIIARIAFFRAASVAFNIASPHELNSLVQGTVQYERDIYDTINARIEKAVGGELDDKQLLLLTQHAYKGTFMTPAEFSGLVKFED